MSYLNPLIFAVNWIQNYIFIYNKTNTLFSSDVPGLSICTWKEPQKIILFKFKDTYTCKSYFYGENHSLKSGAWSMSFMKSINLLNSFIPVWNDCFVWLLYLLWGGNCRNGCALYCLLQLRLLTTHDRRRPDWKNAHPYAFNCILCQII